MPCVPFNGGVVCFPNQYVTVHKGRRWFFEVGRIGCPILLRKDGEPAKRQPMWSETHPFWNAYSAWERRRRKR